MGDVDQLQNQEEAAAQRAANERNTRRERDAQELREAPQRPGLATRAAATRIMPLAQVHPGDNIRPDLPEVQELARSIREVGLLTPLLVRPWDTDPSVDGPLPTGADASVEHVRLIAGHRRHAALTALSQAGVEGFDEVACEVRAGLSEAEVYALMLTENVQRVALEPIQAARALRLLLDLNEGMDVATLSRSLGLRPAWATKHLKLLDLPQEVQDRLEAGDVSLTIADLLRRGQSAGRIDADRSKELARKVASGEITTAQVREEAGPPPRPNTPAPRTVGPGEAAGAWQPLSEGSVRGEYERPATPLSGTARDNPYASGEVIAPAPAAAAAAAAAAGGTQQSQPKVSYEDRLDAYLLGRALREWADDAYLDELGIDRIQADTYAMLLGFEERVAAIRHLSAELMEREALASPTA